MRSSWIGDLICEPCPLSSSSRCLQVIDLTVRTPSSPNITAMAGGLTLRSLPSIAYQRGRNLDTAMVESILER